MTEVEIAQDANVKQLRDILQRLLTKLEESKNLRGEQVGDIVVGHSGNPTST